MWLSILSSRIWSSSSLVYQYNVTSQLLNLPLLQWMWSGFPSWVYIKYFSQLSIPLKLDNQPPNSSFNITTMYAFNWKKIIIKTLIPTNIIYMKKVLAMQLYFLSLNHIRAKHPRFHIKERLFTYLQKLSTSCLENKIKSNTCLMTSTFKVLCLKWISNSIQCFCFHKLVLQNNARKIYCSHQGIRKFLLYRLFCRVGIS